MGKFTYVLVMLIIAVLFSVFTYSVGYTITERPNYNDYCADRYRYQSGPMKTECEAVQASTEQIETCVGEGNILEPIFENGCVVSYECSTCQKDFEGAQKDFSFTIFLSTTILGLIAVIVGLFVKGRKEVHEWIANGFLLGGLISIMVGTIFYFGDAPRAVRPVIMLAELGIIIMVALKKLGKK